MAGPSFDDLPVDAPVAKAAPAPASAPMFDDLPDHAPTPKTQAPASVPPGPVSFDSLPDHAPVSSPAPVVAGQVRGTPSPKVLDYLQNHPTSAYTLQASPIAPAQMAKAGTVGTKVDVSDRQREADQMKDSAMGFFNARIKQYFSDPDFLQLSKEEQDHVLDTQISQWEATGLPAGKFNGASPDAFKGVKGETTPREAWNTYANDLRTKGLTGAQEPGAMFKPDGSLVVAKAPTMLGSEVLGAAGVSGARAIPGIFGGNLAGEGGAALGGSVAGAPGALLGGIIGSIGGAFGADKLISDYAEGEGHEGFRNGLQSLDDAAQMAEEEHPIASAVGRAGAQAAQNRTGLLDLIAGKGLSASLAPRLTGGVIGGGIEAGSEAGRGDKFDPYKIGEAALSGTVFTKPRYIGEGPVPMSFEGRNWTDTNTPKPQLYTHVDGMLRAGASPAEIINRMGESLPDTPENRQALRIVSADIRHGRDPAQSMDKITFRPNGLSVDKTAAAINEHIKDWADAPGVQVHDSYDSSSIPADMKDKVGPGTLGWKDANGEIHVVASQHATPEAVTATMYHEGMHAGLVRAYQGGLDERLAAVYDGANPRLRKALTTAEAEQKANRPDWDQMTETQQKSLVADEVLASTAENGIHKGDFDKIAAYVRNFGRAHLGELGKRISYSDAEVRQIMSTGYDAVSKGSGDTTGPLRYLNFGPKALNADNLSREGYLKGHEDLPDTPEYQQGWFKGPDGKARFEMSDHEAGFKQGEDGESPAELMAKPGQTLGNVLHHPTLFEAYPHLRDIKFRYNDDLRSNGTWDPTTQEIMLSKNAREPMGTLLHEVQHAIQDHEGFASGANDRAVYRTAPTEDVHKVVQEQIETASARADKYAEEYHLMDEASKDPRWKELRRLHDQYKHVEEANAGSTATRAAYETYQDAAKKLRTEMGIDNPWDNNFADLKYKLTQSEYPIEWHLDNARKDYERNTQTVADLIKASDDEHLARAAVRHNSEMSSKLYYRATGEYEARAAADRRHMDDDQRYQKPQFEAMDSEGVHPDQLYTPMKVGDPNSSQELVGKKPMRSNDNEEELPDQRSRVSSTDLENPTGGRKMANPDSIDWDNHKLPSFEELPDQPSRVESGSLTNPEGGKNIPNPDELSTRFSRKYSGNFKKDYDSRQERTEDLVSGHFGSAVYKNVRGMMRPLEEYNAVTTDDIKAAARELQDQGFNAELAVAQGAIPDNSGYVVALKDLVTDKLSKASEIAGRYRSTGGMRHERELMSAVTELGQVMSVFDKTATNLGRNLYALRLRLDEAPDAGLQRMLDSIRFANGKMDPVQMDKIAQALLTKNPIEIRKAIDKFDPTWKKYGQSLFYNFILGSKSVQIGNILGNTTHIMQKGVGDIIGYGVGLGQEAAYRVGDKLKLDVSPPDRMHLDELTARAGGVLAGLMNKETYNSHRAFNTAAKEFVAPAGGEEHTNKFSSQAIENLPTSLVLEYGTRGLQAADAFFRTVIEHSAMQGLATREARKLNNGKAPSNEQIADVMAAPSREMLGQVSAEADRMLFQEQPFRTANHFSKMMRSILGGWIISPIIKTPSNIGRTAFEMFDPTGRITQRNRDALKAGGPEANRVRAGQIMAGALWAGAIYLMQNNLLNGGGPSNPAARAQWLMSHQPYTIGNAETGFYPLRSISPIGDGLSAIADFKDAGRFGKDPEMGMADKAQMVAAGMTDAYLQNSFLSSVTNGLERGAKPTIQNLLGTLVQSAASVPLKSQYDKEKDPYVRDTSNEGSLLPTMGDKASLMNNPGAEHYFKNVRPREELPIRRDPFGAAILSDSPTSSDPIGQEIGRIVDSTGKAVIPAFSRVSKGEHVPNDLYNSFMTIAGPPMREAVKQIMDDPVYKKALTDEQRAAIIHSNKSLKGLHERLNKQLQQMMLDRKPDFESKFISPDLKTLLTIPGEN